MISALLLAIPGSILAAPEDLAKRYPGKLGWVEYGLTWSCGPADVWQLKSFALEFGRDFEVSCGKADVALGVHEGNVLWAVVFPEQPEQPGKIRAKGQPGDGEQARTILLRFAPAEIARVFPSKTVGGPGDAWLRAHGERIFRRKIAGQRWSTPAGNPTIVQPGFTLVDIDTPKEKRRSYELDAGAGQLAYLADFESKPVPPAGQAVERKEAERVFGEVWSAFDREYANFVLLPELDWGALGKLHGKQLARVETSFDLAAVLADMLARLEDLHVWVKADEDWLPGYSRPRPLNASWKGSLAQLASSTEAGDNLTYGRTSDGIGYLNVTGLGDEKLPEQADRALEELADTWALVIDLRFNGGGDELLARAIAGRFLDQERVYSKNRYRSGPDHDDLGEVLDRACPPRGPWRYESPVIALWGQKTMSSAESFALMLAQCPQVTTVGDRTAGSSANPRRIEPGLGITVNLPRWQDMDPSGKPIEHVGIRPALQLDHEPEKFTDQSDPVLEVALARLRKQPSGERKPGQR